MAERRRVKLDPKMVASARVADMPRYRTALGPLALVHSQNAVDVPIDKQVEALAASGLEWRHIAAILKTDVGVLREKYQSEYDRGEADMVFKVATYMVKAGSGSRIADRDAVTAGTLVLKSKAGWSDGGIGRGGANVGGPTGAGLQIDPRDEGTRRKQAGRIVKFAAAILSRATGERVALDPKPGPAN